MILYLTHNDQPSGVYWSQVTDVVAHLDRPGEGRVRLLALVSPRSFLRTRKAIKQHSPEAIVLPMVPTMQRWRWNVHLLSAVCRLLHPEGIMARGPFATWMALRMRDRGLVRNICFDARGAYAAEWNEYRIVDDDALIAQVRPVEQEALEKSDMRLAVSNALVDHWRGEYGYTANAHVVVPCTLSDTGDHPNGPNDPDRTALGFTGEDIVLAYAGSVAGWQSFGLLAKVLTGILEDQPSVKVLFLSPENKGIDALAAKFPGRVSRKWVDAGAVPGLLGACDHGLLLREGSVTNRVASPTKFAEYLEAGLPVIVSEHLGDHSAFVVRENAGHCIRQEAVIPVLHRTDTATRARMQALASSHFSKQAHEASYRKVLNALGAGKKG